MARHRLDLLPLLDVFMVVLFVFATIQEQRLDDTTRDATQLQQRVAEAEQVLQAREQAHDQAQQLALVEIARLDEALSETKAEAEHLRRALDQAHQSLATRQDQARRELALAGVPEQTLERIDLLSRVLDKYSVFEIDVVGTLGEDGQVINRCCYRTDPLLDQWQSCGIVPAPLEERTAWLDEGAGGLVEALRRTKGGNAMTLVRQHERESTFRIASRLAEQLRERFSDQIVDFESVPGLVLRCAD